MSETNLKRVKLDEIELALELLKKEAPQLINNSTSKEIARIIEDNFNYACTEQDVFLLHEPTIEQDILAMKVHHKVLGLI